MRDLSITIVQYINNVYPSEDVRSSGKRGKKKKEPYMDRWMGG